MKLATFRSLTAAAAMAGQSLLAATALQELRRVQPNISLGWIEGQMPMKLDAEREYYVEAFRQLDCDSFASKMAVTRPDSRFGT